MNLRIMVGCALIVFFLAFATIVAFGMSQPETLAVRVEKPDAANTDELVSDIAQNASVAIPPGQVALPPQTQNASIPEQNASQPQEWAMNETPVQNATADNQTVQNTTPSPPAVTADPAPPKNETAAPPPPPPKKRRTRAS